jgi:hypothetical protein
MHRRQSYSSRRSPSATSTLPSPVVRQAQVPAPVPNQAIAAGSTGVLDRGRLPFLDEDGFRELAAEFGNQDELLAYPQVRGY